MKGEEAMKTKLKTIAQKITIVISILLTFNFVVPTHIVQADVGGILLSPLVALLAGIGDGAMTLLQWAMIGDFSEVYQERDDATEEQKKEIGVTSAGTGDATVLNKDAFNGDYKYPIFKYSPEQIFNNEIAALDVNFIQNSTAQEGMEGQDKSSVVALRPVIAKWYVAIRNLALVGLLSVLVYVGIRMLMASASSDKAKYKQMLFDWIVALCLLFVFHFIMSFVMIIVDNLTDMLGSSSTSIRVRIEDEEFNTNLMGLARLGVESKAASEKIAFTLIYLVLVIYTGIFTFVYLKRLLYMAFLTLMAPLVTLTYPIDKISDGKAQAFDTWIKEYVFNALLQPFHLLLYTILVSSAIQLAANNMLYAIAAIGFLLPAEKLLRRMFGFEKSGTASSLGAFAGGALASQAISKAASALSKSGKSSNSGKSSSESHSSTNNTKVKTKDAGYGAFEGVDNGSDKDSNNAGKDDIVKQQEREALEEKLADGQINKNELTPEQQALLGNTQDQYGQNQQQVQNTTDARNEEFRRRTQQAPHGAKEKMAALGRGIKMKASPHIPKNKDDWKRIGKKTLKAAPKVLASGARFAGKAAGLAAFGMAGAAAGIATGDAGKAVQFALTGAAAGGTVGSILGKKATNAGRRASSAIKDTYKMGAYGVEGASLMNTKEEYKNDETNRKFIADEMAGSKRLPLRGAELDKEMDRAADYKAYGIDDNEEIVKAMKYEDQLVANGMSNEQARGIAAKTSTLSTAEKDLRDKLSDTQKCEALRQKQARMIKAEADKNGRQLSSEQINKMSHQVIDSMKKYNGIGNI